jgi:hypothetical protein
VTTILTKTLSTTHHVSIKSLVYPQFETRGELSECVARFRDWLQNQVIDLEVSAGTPSPTVSPSVHVILCGHSMGGIVAADAVLSIAGDPAIHSSATNAAGNPTDTGTSQNTSTFEPSTLLFPDIKAVLAFDTPYLGISPGVLAHGAETHLQTASSVLDQFGGLGGIFGGNKSSPGGATNYAAAQGAQALKALPPAPSQAGQTGTAASAGGWSWGKIALAAGGAAVIAAGSAAAYSKRKEISEGVGWVGSHLEFVGCLMRPEDLRRRVEKIEKMAGTTDVAVYSGTGSRDPRMQGMERDRERGRGGQIGWVNMFTKLGRGAEYSSNLGVGGGAGVAGHVLGTGQKGRTFCNVPKEERRRGHWVEEVNDQIRDEVGAHMSESFHIDIPIHHHRHRHRHRHRHHHPHHHPHPYLHPITSIIHTIILYNLVLTHTRYVLCRQKPRLPTPPTRHNRVH